MSILKKMQSKGLEDAGDRLGGFTLFETDVYKEATIKMVFLGKSDGGAHNFTINLDLGGKEYRETIYFTNKKGENFYVDKNDASKSHPLPGYTLLNDLSLVTTGIEISEQEDEPEEKVVKLYNPETKKEQNTKVESLEYFRDQKVSVAIVKELLIKQKKEGDTYVDTDETREANRIEKFFHDETGMTVSEIRAEQEEALFMPKWIEKNQNKTLDKTKGKGKDGGKEGRPGNAPKADESAKPKKSLFGK